MRLFSPRTGFGSVSVHLFLVVLLTLTKFFTADTKVKSESFLFQRELPAHHRSDFFLKPNCNANSAAFNKTNFVQSFIFGPSLLKFSIRAGIHHLERNPHIYKRFFPYKAHTSSSSVNRPTARRRNEEWCFGDQGQRREWHCVISTKISYPTLLSSQSRSPIRLPFCQGKRTANAPGTSPSHISNLSPSGSPLDFKLKMSDYCSDEETQSPASDSALVENPKEDSEDDEVPLERTDSGIDLREAIKREGSLQCGSPASFDNLREYPRYAPDSPFSNHVLFDEPVFVRMNKLRQMIHNLELSGIIDISVDNLEPSLVPYFCEGDLLERTLELARANYKKQLSLAVDDPVKLANILADLESSTAKLPQQNLTINSSTNTSQTSTSLSSTLQAGQEASVCAQATPEQRSSTFGTSQISAQTKSEEKLEYCRRRSFLEKDPIHPDLWAPDVVDQLRRFESVALQLLSLAAYYRKRFAKKKVERLLGTMLVGASQQIDTLFSKMGEQKMLDAHLLNYLDELIADAHQKYSSYMSKQALSERVLRTLKRRIVAHLEMMKLNKHNFIRILSLCFQTQTEKRRSILKATLYTYEDLERFKEWLEEGIEYGEEMGKLSKEHLKVMKSLAEDCDRASPLKNRILDNWNEENSFQSDLNLQYSWDTMVDQSKNKPCDTK